MRVISRYDTTKHNNPLSESLYNRGKPDSEIQPEQREGGGKSIDSREPMEIYLPFHFPNENPFYRCQIVS